MTTAEPSSQTPSATRRLPVGTRIEDRYEIIDFLGAGGFASVYRTRQIQIDRVVALKMLNIGHLDDSGDFEERFIREAKIAASIRHPNVVTIHDVGVGGPFAQPYIAMELLDGHDLEVELQQSGGLEPQRALELFEEVLEALGEGHKMGVVHKDLKPGNLFMSNAGTRREALVVLDFGVARMDTGENARLTATGQFLGTPQYIAPEYAQYQIATPALDVYQMGLILIEALTGEAVVESDNPMACLMAHCSGQLAIPDAIKESRLWPVLDIALAIEHKDRYPNANAFRDALLSVMSPELYDELDSVRTSDVRRPSEVDIATGFANTGSFGNGNTITGSFASEVLDGDTDPGVIPSSTGDLTLDSPPHDSNRGLLIGIIALLLLISVAVAVFVSMGEDDGQAEAGESGQETTESASATGEGAVEDPAIPPEETAPDPLTGPEGAGDDPTETAGVEATPEDGPVTFAVKTSPEGAFVLRGSDILGQTPTDLSLELEEGESVELILELKGHESVTFTVDAETSGDVWKKLTKKKVEPVAEAKPKRRSKRSSRRERKREEKAEEKEPEKPKPEEEEEDDVYVPSFVP